MIAAAINEGLDCEATKVAKMAELIAAVVIARVRISSWDEMKIVAMTVVAANVEVTDAETVSGVKGTSGKVERSRLSPMNGGWED